MLLALRYCLSAWTVATTLACVSITPFGSPVVPEVYIIVHRSVGAGASADTSAAAPLTSSSSYGVALMPAPEIVERASELAFLPQYATPSRLWVIFGRAAAKLGSFAAATTR